MSLMHIAVEPFFDTEQEKNPLGSKQIGAIEWAIPVLKGRV